MSGRNPINSSNDIIKESNYSQQTSFVTQDNYLDLINTHLNDEKLINLIPQAQPENNDQSEVNGEHDNKGHIRRRSKKEVEFTRPLCYYNQALERQADRSGCGEVWYRA